MTTVQASAKFIAENAKNVHVNTEACKSIAHQIRQKMIERNYGTSTWSTHPLNPDKTFPNLVDWIFTVDTLNFSFWSDNTEKPFKVSFDGETYTGYWSMVAAINRALKENIPITSPAFWNSKEFTLDLLAHVFRSDSSTKVPLLNERFNALKEAGEKLNGSFEKVIVESNHSAKKIIKWVTTNLKSYKDEFFYKGQKILLHKRAQILVADLWACFEGADLGRFDDINTITMFADYRVPQILYVLGAFKYTQSLKTLIDNDTLLESGSEEEIEIRGCSIHSVELIVDEIKRLDPTNNKINAILVDFYLWDTAKEQENENQLRVKCHRTRSVFY